MKITVRYTTPLTQFTGTRAETLDLPEHASVKDLIHLLAQQYGDALLKVFYNQAQEFEPLFTVARNGQEFQAYDTPLEPEDEIALIARFAGG